jgi:hypothetical protein
VVGVVSVLVTAGDAYPETFRLEMKRLPASYQTSSSSADYLFRSRSYQRFYTRDGSYVRTTDQPDFSKVVVKEPKYAAPKPFRGVAKLGTKDFGFAFDVASAPSDQQAESDQPAGADPVSGRTIPVNSRVRYTRLYFDSNHNGDLTDDPVIEAERSSSSYAYFPRVDVTLDVGGTEMEYAFYIRVYSSSSGYSRAYLYGAAYRHGEITLNGEKKRVVLVDNNSNARFDEAVTVHNISDGTVYPTFGDMIFIDPDPSPSVYGYGYDVTGNDDQQPVGKLVNIDGQFYDMEISPAGDKLTLIPSSAPVGRVTNPNKGFRAIVCSDRAVLKICGGETGQAPLPVGEWKLLSYTIDATPKPAAEEGRSALSTLAKALLGSDSPSRPAWTFVSARAKGSYAAVKVREGEAVELPFGSPYKPIVKVSRSYGSSGTRVAYLSLSLVGVGGEVCSNLMVNGGRPEQPQFTIVGPDGKEVVQGKFRYG